jgi:hypothetical protein
MTGLADIALGDIPRERHFSASLLIANFAQKPFAVRPQSKRNNGLSNVPVEYPLVVVEPELATPISTATNVPSPRTTQMMSRISTWGLALKKALSELMGTFDPVTPGAEVRANRCGMRAVCVGRTTVTT